METLTPRQQQILRVIALEYIANAMPVGSEHIARRYNLNASAATIRNEMAVLEAMGLIKQPHTSAARVPTGHGYRYFVDALLESSELPTEVQHQIRHQFHQIEFDTERWYELTAALLARYVGVLALVKPPHPTSARLKHLELVEVTESLVLLVAVLLDGTVGQHLVPLGEPAAPGALVETRNRLNARFAGKSAAEIATAASSHEGEGAGDLERSIVERLLKLLRQVDTGAARAPSVVGVANVLAQPEFSRAERARDIVEMAESGALVQQLPPLATDDVRTVIGEEIPLEVLHDCSLVIARYGAPEESGGVMAVLGPTRMRYWRAIRAMRYLRQVLDELRRDLRA